MFVSYKECLSFQEASLQRRDYSQERLYEISIIIFILIIIIIIIFIIFFFFKLLLLVVVVLLLLTFVL